MIDDEQNNPVDARVKLQEVEKAWTAFIVSPAYGYYVSARQQEIEQLRFDIVNIDPVERKDEIESYKMRGDLRTTEEFLTLFEETAASLRDRINQLIGREQQSSNN